MTGTCSVLNCPFIVKSDFVKQLDGIRGYALYPHAGDWKQALTVRRGYDYNYPLHAAQVLEHDGVLPAEHSFIKVTPENVVLTAVKKAEDANALILHFYEWAGKETQAEVEVPAGASSAELTDLMENPSRKLLPIKAGSITVPIGKYAIESVRVNYPVQKAVVR